MRYFLGGDLGGSKSHLLIADETGRAVGFAVGTGANHEMVGYGVVTDVVRDLLATALAGAGIEAGAIVGAGMGISGYDWQSERSDQLSALALAGLDGFPVEVVNDAVVGLLAGAREGWGIGLVSGTGCNCWGIDRRQRHGRVLGLGSRVGEFAGGGALVQRAVWAVAREATRRGPATGLTPAFMDYTGTRDADDFLEAFCERRVEVPASAAPLVFRVAARVTRWRSSASRGRVASWPTWRSAWSASWTSRPRRSTSSSSAACSAAARFSPTHSSRPCTRSLLARGPCR